MPTDNQVSAALTDQNITDLLGHLTAIEGILPFLISRAEGDNNVMLGEKSVGFDEKCAAYMASNPQFIPGYVNPAEVLKDRALRAQFNKFLPRLTLLAAKAQDTCDVVGNEMMMADLDDELRRSEEEVDPPEPTIRISEVHLAVGSRKTERVEQVRETRFELAGRRYVFPAAVGEKTTDHREFAPTAHRQLVAHPRQGGNRDHSLADCIVHCALQAFGPNHRAEIEQSARDRRDSYAANCSEVMVRKQVRSVHHDSG